MTAAICRPFFLLVVSAAVRVRRLLERPPRAARTRLAHRQVRSLPRGFRPGAGCFEQLERREVLNATYHGGALLPHVEAQAIYLGANWESQAALQAERSKLDEYLSYLVKSPYMDMLSDAGYNVGQGTASPGTLFNVSLAGLGTITDVDIRGVLDQAIDQSLIQQPSLNRLYIVYVQSGSGVNFNGVTSQTTLAGYHSAYAGADKDGVPFDIHYVVVPHPGSPNPTATTNGFIESNEIQTLALGGTASGTLTPAFNGVAATTVITQTATAAPTAAQVQASLNSIPALTGNVAVTGAAGGPYTISVQNLGNIAPLVVTNATGGLVGSSITPVQDGIDGVTADFDQLTSVTSRYLVNAVTNPDNNYKTRAWYDDAFSTEIADLGVPAAQIATVHSRLGPKQYFVQHVFDQQRTRITPNTLSDALVGPLAVNPPTTVSLTRASVSWSPVSNATGYRVLLVNGTQTTLLARVPATETSTILTNLKPLTTLTLRVEAYNASTSVLATDTTYTVPLPSLKAPQDLTATATASSVALNWKANGGAAGYRVYRISGTKKILLATASETATTHTINGLTPGSTVSFQIEAFRGSQAALSKIVFAKLQPLPLTGPVVSIAVVGGNPSVVKLTWGTVAAAQGYRIYWQNGDKRVLIRTLSPSATALTITGLAAGTRFQVQAFRGTQTATSPWVSL